MAVQGQPSFEQCLSIISEETGVSRDDLDDDTEFSDLGINHVLTRAIIDHIAQAMTLRLPVNVFEDFPDVQSFVDHLKTLGITQQGDQNGTASARTEVSNGSGSRSAQSDVASDTIKKPQSKQPLILLLKGTPATASKNVFLLPDGSGSAMSYARLPTPDKHLALYGLNSPHLGTGPFKTTILGLASLWTDAIVAVQPHGPYVLGGWSAGGYYATEVARLLLARGESVESIVIIDSPCRLEYGAPPIEVFEFLAAKNLMGNFPKGTPAWLMDHFAGTMAAVGEYRPSPVPGVPRVYVIESQDGVLNSEEEARRGGLDLTVGVTRMLLLRRGVFTAGGWDRQFPGAELRWSRMTGSHFTLVQPPHVQMLGSLLLEAVEGNATRLNNWSLWSSDAS